MVTDSLVVDSGRSTLLIGPGGRYRQQGEESSCGCDGTRSWQARPGDDDGWVVEEGGPRTPLRTLLRPSWLLTGFSLEVREPVTACGRDGWRVAATPRHGIRDRPAPGAPPLDRVEVIVDAELGILLRLEEISDGRPVDLTELANVSFDPAQAADDDLFLPPGGWDAVTEKAGPVPGGGLAREAARIAGGLAAGGLGALIRRQSFDPFGQATREEDAEAEMPQDEPAPADPSPVSDEVLHLLHRSEDLRTPGIAATVHQWYDGTAMFSLIPEGAREAGFGGLGSLLDAAGERMSTTHTVSRLRVAGHRMYRIDSDHSGGLAKTIVCDGERRWKTYDDVVTEGPAWPPPREIADLLDSSWLLEYQLSGGSPIVIGGRRGYRLNLTTGDESLRARFLPDEIVVDAEFGVVLRSISYLESRPMSRSELRDVAAEPGEPGDFRPEIPPGVRVVEETGPADYDGPPRPKLAGDAVRRAAEDAKSAFRGFLDLIRGEDSP
jgi:hypothetical protein